MCFKNLTLPGAALGWRQHHENIAPELSAIKVDNVFTVSCRFGWFFSFYGSACRSCRNGNGSDPPVAPMDSI